jgi:hypothetical protein
LLLLLLLPLLKQQQLWQLLTTQHWQSDEEGC